MHIETLSLTTLKDIGSKKECYFNLYSVKFKGIGYKYKPHLFIIELHPNSGP
jgi:hypothetical protein